MTMYKIRMHLKICINILEEFLLNYNVYEITLSF